MNSLYDYLVKKKTKTISDHELSRWPTAQVEELKNKNYLRKAQNINRIYCDSCEESCPADDYEVIEVPGKGQMAAFVCPEKDEMGFIAVPLSRRRHWSFCRTKKMKKTSMIVHKAVLKEEAICIGKSFFVYLSEQEFSKNHRNTPMKSGIAFFYNDKIKLLPFRKKSHVAKVLPKFIDGSMTSKEIQQYAESSDKPRFIVKNINKSILSRLRRVGLIQINNKFVCFNGMINSYTIEPKIISQQQYKDFLATIQT